MKTTRQRLLNIVITMSVIVNLALLGGVGYLASLDEHDDRICSTMSLPVVIYVNKTVEISDVATALKSPAKQ